MVVRKTFSLNQKARKPRKFLSNYLTIMRKITNRIIETKEVKKLNRSMRITFALNTHLCQQAENMLNSQRVQNNFTYRSLSELIRKSLEAYQNEEIEINLTKRNKFTPKREITVRFSLNPGLLNFYY